MNDVNIVCIAGRITNNAESTEVSGNNNVVKFSIASNKTGKDSNKNYIEKTNFFECEIWGKKGIGLMPYLKKGTALTVDGNLNYQAWVDKNGKNQSKVVILCRNVNIHFGDKTQAPRAFNNSNSNEEIEF